MKRGFLNSSKAKKEPLYPVAGPSAEPLPGVTVRVEKLAYGKVENPAVPPEGYIPQKLEIAEADRLKTDYSPNATVFTTIPSTGDVDPDGQSEWIVRGSTKAKVLNAPGFLQPVPKPVEPSHVVKSTPDKGMGVFATRDIKFGELIFAERPLIVTPRGIPVFDPSGSTAHALLNWEQQLECAVGRMLPENAAAFKSLMNSHKEDGSGQLLGIIRTNGFDTGLFDGERPRPDGATNYGAVVNIGSRINHSCMPNVTQSFSIPSFSCQFTAKVDIKAGEQLFYSYCEIQQSAAKRQAELAPYGFVCDCPACVHATPETDKLREEYQQRNMAYTGMIHQWLTGRGRVVESMLDPVLEFREALIKEGLHWTGKYKATVLMIQLFYEHLGLHKKAKPYKKEYSRYKLGIMP